MDSLLVFLCILGGVIIVGEIIYFIAVIKHREYMKNKNKEEKKREI